VRRRFGRWILDTARNNRTDGVEASAMVPFRDLFALAFPVTYTLRPFPAKKGHSADEIDRLHAAWLKSCLLQVTLWSHPYVKDGDFWQRFVIKSQACA
jgi:hypothetical protein